MGILKNAYALLIGISYEDGLDTIGDALDLAEVLTDEKICGYPKENVMLVTGPNANREGILNAFDELIDKTNEESSIFLYYSGHGDVVEDVFHFVPHGIVEGMEFEEYSLAWVTAEDIKNKINKLSTRRLIFFMDCCHATGMALGGFSVQNKVSSKPSSNKNKTNFDKLDGLAQKVDNEKGISIVASCKEEQESYQLENDKNSLFTKHLLLALKAQHQSHFTDPYVRILEVASYLLRVIPPIIEDIAKNCDPPLDIKQEPYVNLEMYDNFILSYVPAELRAKHKLEEGLDVKAKSPKNDQEERLIYRETAEANNLILFINGFTGEGSGTFGNLPELLMKDSNFDGWDMRPFGYSRFIDPEFGKHVWGGIKDIDRICDYLCTSIKYKFEKYNRIAIVAHGLGGLIAQRAILDFKEENQQKISHLILMGCPSNGISSKKFSTSDYNELEEIREEGSFITKLRNDWNKRFGNTLPFSLKSVAATDDQFVEIDSCFKPFNSENCISVEGNHFSIVKPKDNTDPSYQLIQNCLTFSEHHKNYGNSEEINLALGKYDSVVKALLPRKDDLDLKGIKQLIFALEGLDRREEALQIIESHPKAKNNTDLMGIIGGRHKRNYLKVPSQTDGDAALVYYGLALEIAEDKENLEQIYYLAINLAFLNLVILEEKKEMKTFANKAKTAALKCEDNLWKFATLGEAYMYLGDFELSKEYYEKASEMAGVREKISIHLNASTGFSHLINSSKEDTDFQGFLKEKFLT